MLGLAGQAPSPREGPKALEGATLEVLDVKFVGAAPRTARVAERLPGESNYLIGNDESKWVRGAPSYRRARYGETWPGVGVTWLGTRRDLRFDFDVAAGADVESIVLSFDGADSVTVGDDGALHVAARRGEVVVSKPLAFQADGEVAAQWKKLGGLRVGFDVAGRDASRSLVIDPSLAYSTYVGWASTDYAGGVAVDTSSNAYVSGATISADFPSTSGAYQTSKLGAATSYDAYCLKFDSTASTLVYATYLGSTATDIAYALAVDGSGAAYLTGNTQSTSFPTTTGAPGIAYGYNAFATKLSANGSSLVYSTPIGYASTYALAIAVDSAGAAYIPSGTDQPPFRVTKVNPAGTAFAYDVTLGSPTGSSERPVAVAVDANGAAYVAGWTNSNALPTTAGAYQTTYGGGQDDAFVAKLASNGATSWCTYLGGAGVDVAYGVALDASGAVWVVGDTAGSGFPTTSGAWQTTYGGGTADAYVTKLSASGSAVLYSTFLGGAGADYATAVVRDRTFLYVAAASNSTNFPVLGGAAQSSVAGGYDAALTVFDVSGGPPLHSTYYGGTQAETQWWNNLAVDPLGDAWLLINQTTSTDIPTANAYDAVANGTDGALAKFSGMVPVTYSIGPVPLPQWTQGAAWTFPLTSTGAFGSVTWTLFAGSLPPGLSLSAAGVLSGAPTAAGSWTFTLQAVDSTAQVVRGRLTLVVNPPPVASSPPTFRWTRTRPLTTKPLLAALGTPPFTWTVSSGTVPPGLAMAADGSLSGTPTELGPFVFTAAATDARGAKSTTPYAVVVAEVPSVKAQTLSDRTETADASAVFESLDGTPPLTWSVVGGMFPFAKTIDASSGVIQAKTIAAGVYSFTLRVTDVAGATGDRAFTLKLNPTPKIDTGELPLAAAGRPYVATLHAHDGTPPARWYAFTPLPFGMAVDADSGRLTGVPGEGGVASMPVLYADAGGGAAEKTLALDVAAALDLTRGKASAKADFGPRMPAGPRWYFVELVAGSRLDLSLKLRASDALPALFDAAGNQLDVGDTTKVKGYVVPATGRYFLKLTPPAGPQRKATASIAAHVAAPTKAAGVAPLAASPLEIPFAVSAGSTISVTVKGRARGVVPRIVSVLQNDVDVAAGIERRTKGSTVRLALKTRLAAGEVRLVLAAAQGAGDASYVVEIKAPRAYDAGLLDVPAGE